VFIFARALASFILKIVVQRSHIQVTCVPLTHGKILELAEL
jgi:hypothetical protein